VDELEDVSPEQVSGFVAQEGCASVAQGAQPATGEEEYLARRGGVPSGEGRISCQTCAAILNARSQLLRASCHSCSRRP